MSYDIDIIATDPVERTREDFSPTYNYGEVYRKLWTNGLYSFEGMKCSVALPLLRAGIETLKAVPASDSVAVEEAFLDDKAKQYAGDRWSYGNAPLDRERERSWAPSARNACEALIHIAEGCERWPHGRLTIR